MQAISINPRSAGPKVGLTATAAAKVAELIAKEGDDSLALRLGVRPGGCSGFSYEMYFDSEIDDADFDVHYLLRLVRLDAESLCHIAVPIVPGAHPIQPQS